MQHRAVILFALVGLSSFASPALASPYQCKDNRVEKGSLTQFTIRRSGSDFAIEKGGSTVGNAVRRNGKIDVEVSGSTKATIANGKIEKNSLSWGTVADAQREFDCDGEVAGTLWVLFRLGILS
jgi:hypothetical protein